MNKEERLEQLKKKKAVAELKTEGDKSKTLVVNHKDKKYVIRYDPDRKKWVISIYQVETKLIPIGIWAHDDYQKVLEVLKDVRVQKTKPPEKPFRIR